MIFEKGPLAGQYYRVAMSVCENPVCRCKRLSLYCYSDPNASLEFYSPHPVQLEMDLSKRAITNLKELKRSKLAGILAVSVQEEISEDVWDELGELMFTVKQQQTEESNLDQVDVQFPPEVMSGDGSMVGYYEMFPYAQPIVVTIGDRIWLFDDQYCISPECTCREAAISFVAKASFADSRRTMTETSFRYDYDEGKITSVLCLSEPDLSASEFFKTLKLEEPNLNSLLAERHALLRRLFHRAMIRMTSRATAKGPGRNEPCPCGSGKKYKRCCGNA